MRSSAGEPGIRAPLGAGVPLGGLLRIKPYIAPQGGVVRATAAVRISVGLVTNFNDLQAFLHFANGLLRQGAHI